MPIDKYHPAFRAITRYSCYPDNLFVKEPESNYRAIPNDPIEGYMWYKDHGGLDAYSKWAAPIYSVEDGTVVEVGQSQNGKYGWIPSGNYVAILTDGCIGCEGVAVYKHLMDFSVRVGQHVKKDQQIGRQGDSGAPGAHHLHFDYFIDGVRHDPVPYLEGRKSFKVVRGDTVAKLPYKMKFQYTDPDNLAIHPVPTTTSAVVGWVKPGDIVEVDQIADGNGGHVMAHDSRGWYSMGTTRIWFKALPADDVLAAHKAEIDRMNGIIAQRDTAITALSGRITAAKKALG